MTNRKKVLLAAGGAVLVIVLLLSVSLLLPGLRSGTGSTFSRVTEEDGFSISFGPLNGTQSETFSLREGDRVRVSRALGSGRLSLIVGQEGKNPVYEGNGGDPDSFELKIPQDGVYILTVTGERANGSVSFEIDRKTDN